MYSGGGIPKGFPKLPVTSLGPHGFVYNTSTCQPISSLDSGHTHLHMCNKCHSQHRWLYFFTRHQIVNNIHVFSSTLITSPMLVWQTILLCHRTTLQHQMPLTHKSNNYYAFNRHLSPLRQLCNYTPLSICKFLICTSVSTLIFYFSLQMAEIKFRCLL